MNKLVSISWRGLNPAVRGIVASRHFSQAGACTTGGEEIQIPVYQRNNETTEMKRARLLYQSRKRGTLENGLLLSSFASNHLNNFTVEQLDEYDQLINRPSNDWDIYHWMTGTKDVPSEYNSSVMTLLKEHVQNKNKEARIVQPKLH